MPAVRMTSVWPMAMTATTMTCCRMSAKFCADRKRSLCVAKKAHARISAMNGPSVARGGSLEAVEDMAAPCVWMR